MDINGLSKERIEAILVPEKIKELGLGNLQIDELIRSTDNIEKYLFEDQDLDSFFSIANVIKATGKIEEYLTLEKIEEYDLKKFQVDKLIRATQNVEEYLFEGQNINDLDLRLGIANVIKATGKIEEYLTPEKVNEYEISFLEIRNLIKLTKNVEKYLFEGQDIDAPEWSVKFTKANIIKATENIEEYLTPEKIKEYSLESDDVRNLIKATGNIEKYLFKWQNINDPYLRLGKSNVIKLAGNIEEYLTPEKIKEYSLESNDVSDLIKATGKIEKYLVPEKIKELGLGSFHITDLIKATGNIEEYLTPEKIEEYGLDSSGIADLIKATGKVEEYLTPEKIEEYGLDSNGIAELIEATGNIEKYLTPEKVKEYGITDYNIGELIYGLENSDKYILKKQVRGYGPKNGSFVQVIKATERIEEYLTLENIKKYNLSESDITALIRELDDPKRYLFEGQDINDPSLELNIANIIKTTGKIEEYLVPEKIKEYDLSSKEITNLIKETGNIEKYLFKEQDKNDQNLYLDMANIIKATGNIKEYLRASKLKELGTYCNGAIKLIKEIDACPKLEKYDYELLEEFNDLEIIERIVNLDENKQKDAITILDNLSKSNSGELRRIKVPIAFQIIKNEPDQYKEILNKIEKIYLTNNIPTVGKLYLVFQELHPNFLGEEKNQIYDDSYANIPSLEVATKPERKHIIFSDLLKCALESNDRNIRDYLDAIEQGNMLYEQLLAGELKLDELDSKDKKIEILSKYRDILSSLYNVTSKGKRKENARENTGNLEKDLKELDSLFAEDLIEMNLPDRIIRTFAHGTGIRTFEQAKSIIEDTRKNTHTRNVEVAKEGKVELKQGDFVKGIAETQYFPAMLQKGILAKDYLGGSATHDATPLDTDVEKVLEEEQSFANTLSRLSIVKNFTEGDVDGKKLGTIMLVFSGDNFIETRDSSGKINEANIKKLKTRNDKKEVFYNFGGSAYGIRTGIGSTNIKYIIADRYIDKLGLEIAKNGFYIPVVDKEGNVIYTEKMYNEFRKKMQGLSHYGENEFVVDDTARNEGTRQIAELTDKIKKDAQNKRDMILKTLEEAVKQNGYTLSKERKTDLIPGVIEFIDTGSTGRGTNEPGDGDFDFMVRMDKILSDAPQNFRKSLKDILSKIKNPKEVRETGKGDFRYKGVSIEGLAKEVDIDLTFTVRTDEIEYSTDECIKERLNTIKSQSLEDYKYVVANILLAKKLLKQAKAYKKSDAQPPEVGKPDTRGGLGAVGIENWVLQNGGSFYKAAESFLKIANESKDLEEFRSKYSVWDFGENHTSAEKDIYAHDNFVFNMNEDGYVRMKEALERYKEAVEKEKFKQDEKIGIADIIAQDTSVIEDTPYMLAVKSIMRKENELNKEEKN